VTIHSLNQKISALEEVDPKSDEVTFEGWCAEEAYRLEWPSFNDDTRTMAREEVDTDPRHHAVNERMKALWRAGPQGMPEQDREEIQDMFRNNRGEKI